MLYLNENHLLRLGVNWIETIRAIEEALASVHRKEYVQPVKPYLRYGDLRNRIIAMPAFLGGRVHTAGIKWIASFPGNVALGLPRAHSIIILNDADTGVPSAIINTPLASIIRTASVSGLILQKFMAQRKSGPLKVGIAGWGPIGKAHLAMCKSLLNGSATYHVYDKRPHVFRDLKADSVVVADQWQDAYHEADVFITCTVADSAYIDLPPKPGSLHLNVSLRDYKPCTFDYFKDNIIVDDWDEVCRERTDIEVMHREKGLQKEGTRSIAQLSQDDAVLGPVSESPIFFNPMGLGVFDIAIAAYYRQKAAEQNIGITL